MIRIDLGATSFLKLKSQCPRIILPIDPCACFQSLGVARMLIPPNSYATSVTSAFSAGPLSY